MRKFLLFLLLTVVVLVATLWWLLGDPNRFKAPVTDLIQQEVGLWVALDGDLGWRLWPPVQLVVNDVRLDWTPEHPEPLAQIGRAQLDVSLWSLLTGERRLVVNGLRIEDLHANLVQVGDSNNWMPPSSAVTPPVTTSDTRDSTATPGDAWLVESIAVENARIRYLADGEETLVALRYLRLGNIAPGREMPLRSELSLSSADEQIDLALEARVSFDAAFEQIQLHALQASGQLASMNLPFALELQGALDLAADSLNISAAQWQAADASGSLQLRVEALSTTPQVRGHLQLPLQRPSALLALLELDELAEQLALDVHVAYQDDDLRLNPLRAQLDDSRVSGEARLRLAQRPPAAPMLLDFNLEVDRFVIPETETTALHLGAPGPVGLMASTSVQLDPADLPLLPLDTLAELDWQGQARIGELVYAGASFPDVQLRTHKRNQQIQAQVQLPDFFGGSANTELAIDLRGSEPAWHVKPNLQDVQSQRLLTWLDQDLDFIALLLANSELRMRGNSERALIQSMQGGASFDGGQGLLSILPLKEQVLAIASLAGSTERVESWPDRLNYQRLRGDWRVNGNRQEVDMVLDNMQLRLRGDYDLLSDAMDMRLELTIVDDPNLRPLRINERLVGVPLPIRCRGLLSAPSCRPDADAVRDLLRTALRDEAEEQVQQRLQDAIERKLSDDARDSAQELLRSLRRR